MKRRLTPQEKKRNAYDRDHVTLGWKTGTKFRKQWRQKKVLNERSLRRAWSAATQSGSVEGPEVIRRRRSLLKDRPPTVRELLEHKAGRREGSHGAKAERGARQAQSWNRQVESAFPDILRRILRRNSVGDPTRLRDLPAFIRSQMPPGPLAGEIDRFLRRYPTWMKRFRDWRRTLWRQKRPPRRQKAK